MARDYGEIVEKLEHLASLVDALHQAAGGEEGQRLFREICEVYGQVSDVYQQVVGKLDVQVPIAGTRTASTFPNYFEAGYMSSRTFHRGEGQSELLKVIGSVKRLAAQAAAQPHKRPGAATGSRVFVVHGHHEGALQSVARFIEKLDLPLTVLREEPNQGRTVIEKFEDAAGDAGFAVVLFDGR